MWTADLAADRVNSAKVAGGVNAPRQSQFAEPFDPSKEASILDSAIASFTRENPLASLAVKDDTSATEDEITKGIQENFNPYLYLQETYQGQDISDILEFVVDGRFDQAVSGRQVDTIIASLREEKERTRVAFENPVAGFAGALFGAVFDPTSYIPYAGAASKVGRLGRAALYASGSTLASETLLQGIQDTRTLEETIMNIGTAGALGGGIGFFAPVAYRKNTLNRNNPDNPLLPSNFEKSPITARTLDGELDELSPSELARLSDDLDSLSAARADGTRPKFTDEESKIARSEPTTRVGKAVRQIGDFFNSKTIVGRVVRAESGEARMLGLSLMDPGGTLLKGHLAGKSGPLAAENLKSNMMVAAEQLSASMQRSVYKLRHELGQKVSEADVYKLTQRVLFQMDDPELIEQLVKTYGKDAFEKIKAAAETNAKDIHKLNNEFEGMMVQAGILQDTAKVAALRADVEKLKAEVEQLKAADAPKAEIDRARSHRDAKKEELFEETRKAKPLGDEYGHAQMWNREAILENPDDFKTFLRDAMLDTPDADWLAKYFDIDPEEFVTLRETDRPRYDNILEEWSGDAWYHRIQNSEAAVKAADDKMKSATLDLNDALRQAGVLKREQGQVRLSEARKIRDKINKDLEAAKQHRAKLQSDIRMYRDGLKASAKLAKQAEAARPKSALETFGQKPKAKPTPKQVNEAHQQVGKADELVAQYKRETDRMRKLHEQQQKVDAALSKVESHKAQLKEAKAKLDDLVAEVSKVHKMAAKDLRSVKRQLISNRKSTPLDDMIDDVYKNLTTTGRVPQGILDRLARESDRTSGRVKERMIHLNPDQRINGIKSGWLRDDLPLVLHNQYDQVSAELALREALEIGPNGRFKSWDDRLKAVEEDYNRMISDGELDRAAKDRLRKERDIILDDLVEARDRIRGSVMASDGTTHGWANWLSAKVRGWTFARYGGGFLVSSLTDLATFSLRHGGMGKAIATHGRRAVNTSVHLARHGVPRNELEAFVASMELGMGAAAHARRFGSEDLVNGPYGSHGIGTGKTRKVTGAIDKGMQSVNEKVGQISGLPIWNRTFKIMAGHMMAVRIRDSVGRWDSLSAVEKADLASVGIGKAEAVRIHKQIQEHGTTHADGRFDPGIEKWDADDARQFLISIERDMNRAINTPGVGDTPRLMSTWWGKLWLQFQTFGFTFMNRYLYPAAQRASMGDKQAMASMAYLMGSATMVMVLKDVLNGRNPSERFHAENLPKTFHEIVDRSGVLGWTSPYVSAPLTLMGFGGASRYARNSALTTLGGVNTNVARDVSAALMAAADADPAVIEKTLLLMPLSTHSRLFMQMME